MKDILVQTISFVKKKVIKKLSVPDIEIYSVLSKKIPLSFLPTRERRSQSPKIASPGTSSQDRFEACIASQVRTERPVTIM